MELLSRITQLLWTPWLLGAFLAVGGWYSVRTGFFQLFGAKRWLGDTALTLLRGEERSSGGLSRLQALSTALAATIGTGSIAGVATAIFFGGPGAVFWMWVCALLGMMTSCGEKILAVRYRRRGPDGHWRGGPMEYLSQGMKSPLLAGWFALACMGGALVGGDLVQSNSIAASLHSAFGWNRLAVGMVTAALAGVVLAGGIDRIAGLCQLLVPVMAAVFLGSAGAALWLRRTEIPAALELIFTCALLPRAAAGGAAGYGILTALRYGIARGVFTNEAGMGSSAMAHANAPALMPGEQGMWGIFEVFVSTLLVCSATALVILTSGVYDPAQALGAIASGNLEGVPVGVPLTAAAFSASLGPAGELVVSVSLLLFAFSSLLGQSYYGEQALGWLLGEGRGRRTWRAVFLVTAAVGSVMELEAVWCLVDLFTALMSIPNLAGLVVLSPQALECLEAYLAYKEGKSSGTGE